MFKKQHFFRHTYAISFLLCGLLKLYINRFVEFSLIPNLCEYWQKIFINSICADHLRRVVKHNNRKE